MSIPQLSEKLKQEVRHGDLELWCVVDAGYFWWIMDWIKLDNSTVYYNRNILLRSFKEGTLYTIGSFDPVSDELNSACNPPGAKGYSSRLFPVMCIYEQGAIQMLWVASSFRRLGLGAGILNKLMLRHDNYNLVTSEQTEESRNLWGKVNIPESPYLNSGRWVILS